MPSNAKFWTRRLVGFLSGASLAALSIAAPALALDVTLSGAQNSTQSYTGTNLNVATNATFSVTTPTGSAVDLSGTNGLTFIDNYQSVINGADDGIYAQNFVTGALSITSTGAVTGVNYEGIFGSNSGTNLTITANNVTGGDRGIFSQNFGSGALSITSTGTVTALGDDGIYAYNSGTNLTITANNVSG